MLAHNEHVKCGMERPPPYLNGYLTMRMSRADLLRAVTILDAVLQRSLMRNALLRAVVCRCRVPRAWMSGARAARRLLGTGDGEHETVATTATATPAPAAQGSERDCCLRLPPSHSESVPTTGLQPRRSWEVRRQRSVWLSEFCGGEWRRTTVAAAGGRGRLMLLQPTDYPQMLECALSSGALTPTRACLTHVAARLAESSNTPEGRLELFVAVGGCPGCKR